MWVIYVEMGVALAILVLIVWFTWPRKRPGERAPQLQDKDAD
jgi:high-affinity Fe2+/Pb2+ permease